MKPPKRLKIGARWYAVRPEPITTNAADAAGLHLPYSDDIVYDPQQSYFALSDTIFHEAIHAAWYGSALDNLYTNEQEEQVVWTLTPLLLQMLRDNPELVAYLLGR